MVSSRPPPPQGAPPSYAFVTRVYRRSLRPVVMIMAFMAGLWALLWSIAQFRYIPYDQKHAPKLVPFDIALGVMYLVAFFVEVFGLLAAYRRKIPMVRIYAFLSLGAAFLVTAAELIRVIIHFVFKNDLINECTELVTGDVLVTRFGFFGPTTVATLDEDDAERYCNRAWSRDSFTEIAWLIVAALVSFVFASVAFSYYRQLLDPTSPANMDMRAPSNQVRAGLYGNAPTHYAPPYTQDGFNRGAGGFAPPPGPPPMPPYDGARLPGYDAQGYAGSLEKDMKGSDPFAEHDAQPSDYPRRDRREDV